MLPTSHHGRWRGTNRLWFRPDQPSHDSEGTLSIGPNTIDIAWALKDKAHAGTLQLKGSAPSTRVAWTDSFHASSGMTLHGPFRDGLLHAYTSYSDGEGGYWGWTLELDLRSPDEVALRMFNVPPGSPPLLAVDLRAKRVSDE